MLAAGRLTERITLQCPKASFDAERSRSVDWRTQATTWAAVEAITGREVHAAQQIQSAITLRVTIRRPGPNPTATWRALWGCRVLSIEAVLPHPDRDRLVLLCSEGLNDG